MSSFVYIKKWEYEQCTLGMAHHNTLTTKQFINQMGDQGWKLISTCMDMSSTMHLFFEREKIEKVKTVDGDES